MRRVAVGDRVGTGEAEVGDLGVAVLSQQHVIGLEVAMDDTCGVRGFEPARGLEEACHDLTPAVVVVEPPLERAFEQLHREEQLLVDGADVVDRRDVGMGERCHRLRFA